MIYSLLILGAPPSSESANTALRFASAALQAGHSIYRVFFLDNGVGVANQLSVIPQDETDWRHNWQKLAQAHQLDMVVCISSALKRGVIDPTEASRYEKPASNLAEGFEISGLGQLVDATLHSDRVITFGA